MSKNHILKNLHSLIRNSALSYMNNFIWQDIELTEEFKESYYNYLNRNGYDIEFLEATAVITSPSTKYIYVPNQWFVIASYAVEVYEELQKYKKYFSMVAAKQRKKLDVYAKQLRDEATMRDKEAFIKRAKEVFLPICKDNETIEESAARLWRFVNDYAWWSGQKTIDRGDFHLSVILNMLNLVNASQSYVADIVSAYANDLKLRELVKSIDGFTVNMELSTEYESDNSEEETIYEKEADIQSNDDTIPKPERVRIVIVGSNTLKEIKYKG